MASGHRRRRQAPREHAPVRTVRPPRAEPQAATRPRVGGGHPLAVAIFRQLTDRPEADLREVLLAAQAAQLPAADERVALGLAALAACFEGAGGLSKSTYRDWRAGQARPTQWPTSDEIERAFGTWSAATEFARNGGITGAACVARLTATGGHYDADAVIACVSEWAPTVSGPLAFDAYRQWARERMLDPGRARDRYFRTRRPVNRLFGSWEALLIAIGFGDRCANACPSPAQTEERREQAVFWLRVSWRAAGWDGWLTQSAHHEFVRAVQAKRKARGLPWRWLPWAVDVNEMFGSWASGLLAAGLISSKVHAARDGVRTPVRSDEELLDWVIAATRERRRSWQSMSGQEYKRWLRGRRAVGDARPPSYETVSRRFGSSWQAVMRRAAGRARQVRQAGAA